MTRWEYKLTWLRVFNAEARMREANEELTALGEEGWELAISPIEDEVHGRGRLFIFKRPLA